MMQEVKEVLRRWGHEVKGDIYFLSTAVILALLLLVGTGWKLFSWNAARREGAAQLIFSQGFEEYDRALSNTTGTDVVWSDVVLTLQAVGEKHPGSVYAKYAEALQADVLAREGKFDEALALLDQVITKIGSHSPFSYLYKTKSALIKFDAGKTEEAVSELATLADAAENENSDTAAFYLGYYYWTSGQYDKAKTVWARFEKSAQPLEQAKISPWAPIAQVKLAQIA